MKVFLFLLDENCSSFAAWNVAADYYAASSAASSDYAASSAASSASTLARVRARNDSTNRADHVDEGPVCAQARMGRAS
jgi:hypothetical protein